VAQWLARHGQHPKLVEMLWEPLALAALNQDIRAAAAPAFARVLGGVVGPDRRDAAIGLPVRPLDQVFGEPARRYVESRGGSVRLHAPARIALEDGRVAGVEVRGERTGVNRAVAAVPWHGLPGLFSGDLLPLEPLLSTAAAAAPSPIVTVNLWYDVPVLDTPFVGLPGRTMQWAVAGREGSTHVSLVSSGADAVLLVVREPRATFSLAPGQPARPPVETAVDGLWLASDWVDTGLPATIEGAILAGRLAADAA
jgi:zeta-carotene desaturase